MHRTIITTHHHSGRATHRVMMMVKEDIQVIKIERGLDQGHNEQWEGHVLAVYTEGICFLGLYMPHATAARDLLRDQIKAFVKSDIRFAWVFHVYDFCWTGCPPPNRCCLPGYHCRLVLFDKVSTHFDTQSDRKTQLIYPGKQKNTA